MQLESKQKKNNLNKHVESQHEGVYYNCEKCSYKAKTKPQVKQHVRNYSKLNMPSLAQ